MASVNNYALETVTITHSGTGGTTETFNPTITYRTTSHVPVWTGSFEATTKTPSVAAASLSSGRSDVVLNKWATSRILFTDDGVVDADIENMECLTSMASMFLDAVSANPGTGQWKTPNTTDLGSAFQGALVANPDVSGWDTSKATNLSYMFRGALLANPDVSAWDTSSCLYMGDMFNAARWANPDVSGWDTSNVVNMDRMFYVAIAFTGSVANFDMSSVTSANLMFTNTTMSTINYDALLIAWAAQTLQSNVPFSAGGAKYTPGGAAETARGVLTGTYNWTITDGGAVT